MITGMNLIKAVALERPQKDAPLSRNRVVESIIRNPWNFTTKSLGTAKRSNEKDRWDMSFNNIFPGIITV